MADRLYNTDDLPPELELTELEKQEIQEQEELETAIAQFKGEGDVKYYVYRMKPGSRSGEWIDKFPVADYSFDELLEKLRDEYRGGQFRIDIRDKKGIMRNRQVINVEKQPEKVAKENDDNTMPLMAMMKSMQDSTQAMIHQLAMSQKDAELRQSESTSSMILKLMEVMKPQEKKNGFFDDPAAVLSVVTSLKDLIAPKSDETEKMLNFLQLGKEMASGGDENVLQTAISTFGKPIADMASKLQGQTKAETGTPTSPTPPPPPVPVTPPSPEPSPESPPPIEAPAQPQPDTVHQPGEDMAFDPHMLEYEINKICTAAAGNGDHEFWADYIIELFGESMAMRFIGDQAMYDLLFVQYPQAVPHKAWFDVTRTIMIEFLTENPNGVDNNVHNDSTSSESTPTGFSTTSTTEPGAREGELSESFPPPDDHSTLPGDNAQDGDVTTTD